MKKRTGLALGLLIGLMSAGTLARADAYTEAFIAAERGEYARAVALFMPLAEEGNAQAQFNLALMYHGGLGVARSEQEAVRWYQRAAANGSKEAQEFLAVAYQEGWFGLPRDQQQARYWFSRLTNS